MALDYAPRRMTRKRRRKMQVSPLGWAIRWVAVVGSTALFTGAVLWFTGFGAVRTGIEMRLYMALTPAVVLGGALIAYCLAYEVAFQNPTVRRSMVAGACILIALTSVALWNRPYTLYVVDRWLVWHCERAVTAGEVMRATRGCALTLSRGKGGALHLQARLAGWPFLRRLSAADLEAAISAELGTAVRLLDPQPEESLLADPPADDTLRLYLAPADGESSQVIQADVRAPTDQEPWHLDLWWFTADQLMLAGHREVTIP